MGIEMAHKKLEQIETLLTELETWFAKPAEAFLKDAMILRAAERNFQLIVDLAADINTHILIERGEPTPDTYKQTFANLAGAGVLSPALTERLVESAKLRNILVHEYDIAEDYPRFYKSAKALIPFYREYLKEIYRHFASGKQE